MGFLIYLNITRFNPTASEFIIISMLCVYFIISGAQNISPYVDETADRILRYANLLIQIHYNKKRS